MRIDIGSLAFGFSIEKKGDTGTPAWTTSIGQSKKRECRVDYDKYGIDELLPGLIYKAKGDINNLKTTNDDVDPTEQPKSNRERTLFSLFEKVYVKEGETGEEKFLNEPFILTLEKETSESHKDRYLLCYAKYLTYNNKSNKASYKKMADLLGCEWDNSCWFVSDINIVNQDELHFTAYVIDPNNEMVYADSNKKSEAFYKIINENISSSYGYTIEELGKILTKMYNEEEVYDKKVRIIDFMILYGEYVFKYISQSSDFHPYIGLDSIPTKELKIAFEYYKLIHKRNRLMDKSILSPIILYGPPGTGKTYKMQNEYISKFAEKNRFVTTFHQSFSYEEFVEGLKPVCEDGEISYKIEDGIFKQACEQAVQLAGYPNLENCIKDNFENRKKNFEQAIENGKTALLCIDEINRGNVAAIFGDLISLIETNKRLGADEQTEMIVKLPYSKVEFGVPANLLIVCTMNTADRSIQLLDTALRRRFKFEELLPEYKVIKNKVAKNILEKINARIRCLLNKDNQIGHAYFCDVESISDIFSVMINKVIPLLEEYFYNDAEKIRFVLGENDKKEYTFYVEDLDAKNAYKLFDKENFDDKNFFGLNEDIKRLKDEEKCRKYLSQFLENTEEQ